MVQELDSLDMDRRIGSFERKLEELKKVRNDLVDAIISNAPEDIKRDAVLHRFWIAFSIAELTLRKYILLKGMEVKKKSELFDLCFKLNLLGNDPAVWPNMQHLRESIETAHQAPLRDSIYKSIVKSLEEFQYLILRLEQIMRRELK